MIDFNPAKRGIRNAPRRPREKRPFESWQEIEAVAAELGPLYGPMVVFGAATGLRPSELFGLEQRDIDRRLGVVYVRRAFANGGLEQTKTRLSNPGGTTPSQAARSPRPARPSENPILFSSSRGSRIDFRNFGRRCWNPAQKTAGIEPLRDLYDLRHTYVTFALRAGIPVFAVSGFIGSSIAMVDQHYGHLASDSRQHAVSLLDALALERAVDAAWTSNRRPTTSAPKRISRTQLPRSRRTVDARWTPRLVTIATIEEERSR